MCVMCMCASAGGRQHEALFGCVCVCVCVCFKEVRDVCA